MDLERYTERARGLMQAAQGLALREGHQRFTPEHLLKVLLDDPAWTGMRRRPWRWEEVQTIPTFHPSFRPSKFESAVNDLATHHALIAGHTEERTRDGEYTISSAHLAPAQVEEEALMRKAEQAYARFAGSKAFWKG